MIDFSKFTKEDLEVMLETRKKLIASMSFVPNLPEILEEVKQIEEFLELPKQESEPYGKA